MDNSSEKNNPEMLTFSTSIKCQGCIDKVAPVLNQMSEIKSWEVDTKHPEKLMTIQTENMESAAIIAALEAIGYKATLRD